MLSPIHDWEFSSDGFKTKVELFFDHVLIHFSSQPEKPIRYDFNHILESSYTTVASLQVDFELLQYIISLTLPEELSPNAQVVYAFYKAFDSKKITAAVYEHAPKQSDFAHYYRSIGAYGLRQYYETADGQWEQSRQRMHHFFLHGPLMSRIPLAMRKGWKEMVWKALGDNPSLSLAQGFALFDYDKIEEKKYSLPTGTNSGEYIEIYKGHIMIGGFDGKDGGATEYSIENVWNDKFLISNVLEEHRAAIYKNLENAIIGKVPEPILIKPSPITKETQPKTDAPGEAPPA
jgi:hypothetical protein